jgi:hypothetical protein
MDTQSDLLGKCWIAGGELNCRCTAISQISTDGIGTSPYLPGGQDVYAP